MPRDRKVLTLARHHNWSARPGHKILVLDRGAVRFEFPGSWIVTAAEDCVKLLDRNPPDDDCTLAVSYLVIPVMDWSGLPVSSLVRQALEGDERQFLEVSDVRCERRLSLEIAWCEGRFTGLPDRRPAISRICIARCPPIQALVSFDFWAGDLDRCGPVWDTVLATLELAESIRDPTVGPSTIKPTDPET
jgi:hypothetical protein